jgi:hypothetical protein
MKDDVELASLNSRFGVHDPERQSRRTYLGRGTHPAGSSRARNLVGKIKKILSH